MTPEKSIPEAIAAPENGNTRRMFLVAAGAAGACYVAALGYPVYRYISSPVELAAGAAAVSEVTLKDAQKLAPATALMFKFGTGPAMLIHHADGSWVAFGAVCTHLGCTVQYQPERNRIHCACHGGTYDPNTGANISGPPPRPLKKYAVRVTDDAVVVSRV